MKTSFLRSLAGATLGILAAAGSASAQTSTWNTTASGNWNDSVHWANNTIATGAGNTAIFNTLNVGANRTITLNASQVIGNVTVGDTVTPWFGTIFNATGGSTLTMNNSGSPAIIRTTGVGTTSNFVDINVPIILTNGLLVTKNSGTTRLLGSVTGTGNITLNNAVTGVGDLELTTADVVGEIRNLSTLGSVTIGVGNVAGIIGPNVTKIVIDNNGVNTSSLSGNSAGNFVLEVVTGTATVTTSNALRAGNLVNLIGGNLSVTGVTTLTFAGLNGTASTFARMAHTGSTTRTMVLAGNGSYAYAGTVANSPSASATIFAYTAITKNGTGTQVFSGANTYSGNTTVNAGTLLLNNASGSGTGNASVSVTGNNTVLGGNGTLAPEVAFGITFGNGTVLSPGSSAGAIGNLTFALGATTGTVNMTLGSRGRFDLGVGGASIDTPGTSDRLLLTGASAGDFAFNNNQLDFNNTGGPGWYKLFDTTAGNATWTGLTLNASWQITAGLGFTNLLAGNANGSLWMGNGTAGGGDLGDIYLYVIPEPHSLALVAGGLAAFLLRRRRR